MIAQVTSGARSDFQQATREARHMVTECGMSEDIGPMFVENTESPDMRRRIDSEVSRILREAYSRVKTLLVSTRSPASASTSLSPFRGAFLKLLLISQSDMALLMRIGLFKGCCMRFLARQRVIGWSIPHAPSIFWQTTLLRSY